MHLNRIIVQRYRVDSLACVYLLQLCKQVDPGPPVRNSFSSFLGESATKILQENPRQNPPKSIQQKAPTHFCRGAGPKRQGQSPQQFPRHSSQCSEFCWRLPQQSKVTDRKLLRTKYIKVTDADTDRKLFQN